MWALRDAAAAAGHFQTAAHADRYFARVAREVQVACAEGRIPCEEPGLPFLPRMNERDWARLVPAFRRALAMSLYQEGVALTDGPSHGPDAQFQSFLHFLGAPRHLPIQSDDVWQLSGWYASAQQRWIKVRCARASGVEWHDVPRQASPDLVSALAFAGASNSRFNLALRDGAACQLTLADDPNTAVRVLDLSDRWSARLPDGSRIHVDRVVRGGVHAHRALEAKRLLGETFRQGVPWLMALAFAAAVWAVARAFRRRAWSVSLIVALLAWLMAAVRVGLLALVDATSFPGVNILYLAPASHLWLVGAVLLLAQPFLPANEINDSDALPQRG
jgi:hypothetical protein